MLQRDKPAAVNLVHEILKALSKLLSLDEKYTSIFAGEGSVAVMVDECEGFTAIEKVLTTEVNEEVKEEA